MCACMHAPPPHTHTCIHHNCVVTLLLLTNLSFLHTPHVRTDVRTTQTHKHTNTQTHKHTNTQTHKHTNTQTHKHTNTQTHKHTNTNTHTHTHKQTHKHTNTQTHKHTNTQTHKHTNTNTHTQTHKQTHKHAHTHTHTCTCTCTHANTQTRKHAHTQIPMPILVFMIISFGPFIKDETSAQFFYDSKALQKKQNKRRPGDQGGGQAKKHGHYI